MSTFASTFREIICPQIAARCRARGLFIVLDLDTWHDAQAELMRFATQRGLLNLAPALIQAFEEWLSAELLNAITAAEPIVRDAEDTADRVARDIRDHGLWPVTT